MGRRHNKRKEDHKRVRRKKDFKDDIGRIVQGLEIENKRPRRKREMQMNFWHLVKK